MTLDKVSSRTGMNSAHRRETNTRLSGRWLILARVGWIALVLFMLGVAIVSLPASFAVLRLPCTLDSVTCNGSGLLTASQIQELPKNGFSLDAHVWMYLGLGGFYALVSIVLGAIIFWHKSDDWIALLVALLSISTGAVGITGPLQYSSSFWVVLENAVLLIQSLAILYTLALFPNGRDRHREKHGEGDNLKNVATHQRINHAGGKDVYQRFDQGAWRNLTNLLDDVALITNQRNADAGLGQIYHRQTKKQCGRRHDFEVDERLHAHPSDFAQITAASDPDNQG